MSISTNLKSLRKSRNLTFQQLSKSTGISSTSLCAYESDHYAPSITTLLMLADFYHISTDELLDRGSKRW